jgi:ribosome-associated toxin RatA of RatAB toxin-antitoxin module
VYRFRAAAAALLTIACTAQAAAEHGASVEARRRGNAVEVTASATLHAPLDVVWSTLTDYNHLPAFIPGMLRSRVIEYQGRTAIVEELGEARFLFLSFPIDVTIASIEYPPRAIDVHVLKGNLRQLEGGYRIERGEPGTLRLLWRGLIEPEFPLPPLIGEALMRMAVEHQFLGMVHEIKRRTVAAGASALRVP